MTCVHGYPKTDANGDTWFCNQPHGNERFWWAVEARGWGVRYFVTAEDGVIGSGWRPTWGMAERAAKRAVNA